MIKSVGRLPRTDGVPDERPETGLAEEARRERSRRWRRCGATGLSDRELLAVLLGAGRRSGEELADELLARYGTIDRLGRARPEALSAIDGLGPVRSTRLLAGLELGARAGRPEADGRLVVRRPEDLHDLLRAEFRGLDRERFVALYLDTRHRLLDRETVSIGSLNASLVHPREVFKSAVLVSAAALVVAHNHPSGCARPSGDDLELTARLDRCGELLGISLLDHLVVGEQEILSIREYGWPAPRAHPPGG